MQPNISKLIAISQKESRHIIGLMSGTSLDGLDIAYCKITGSGTTTKVDVIHFETVNYDAHYKNAVRNVFAKQRVDFPFFALLNRFIAKVHSDMILSFIRKHNLTANDIDLIASHGQTVMHVPTHNTDLDSIMHATLQIGDGDQIAMDTGIITISDFRQKHVAAGGEGAPLSVYGDFILNQTIDNDRILLNIGGIANFTYLPHNLRFADVFVTDTGPGNTLMDAWMRKYLNLPFDRDSHCAKRGKILPALLTQLQMHPFFERNFPKSTGPEDFNLHFVDEAIQKASIKHPVNNEDMMATLTQFTAASIAGAINQTIQSKQVNLYISGGGAYNSLLVSSLQALLPDYNFCKNNEMGIDIDAKEAIIFAILANEAVAGNPETFAGNPAIPKISMGKFSFPK